MSLGHRLRLYVRGVAVLWGQRLAGSMPAILLATAMATCGAVACSGSPTLIAVSGSAATPLPSAVSATGVTDPTLVLSPTRAPASMPAPIAPVRLALPRSILTAESALLDQLARRHPSLVLASCDTSSQALHLWRSGQADAAIVYAEGQASEAVPLRSIPYVLVGAVTTRESEMDFQELRGIYGGTNSDWRPVVCGDGMSEALLLGLDRIAPDLARYETPEMALEHVATSEEALALLPWDSVDFRVRVISIGDHRLWSEPLSEYPYKLHWWLVGDPGEDLRRELCDGLSYSAEEPVSLAAVGDIMLGRYVGELIALDSPTYPFENETTRSILAGADIAFGNLECPISERGTRQDKGYEFRAAPAVIEGLSHSGLDVISLANNHTGDYGDVALVDTLDALCGVNILPVGAGGNLEEALSVRSILVKGMRVGFLAFNAIEPRWFAATDDSPGSAWLDPEIAGARVRAAAEETDLLFVSCHWGTEYTSYPAPLQVRVARELIEAGADLVIGHHPHVLQAVQYLDSGFVAYSLGNFVFDQFFSDDVRQGAILYCLADRSGLKSVELIPTYNWRAQPRIMESEDATAILDRIFGVTREIGGLPSCVR